MVRLIADGMYLVVYTAEDFKAARDENGTIEGRKVRETEKFPSYYKQSERGWSKCRRMEVLFAGCKNVPDDQKLEFFAQRLNELRG